MDISLDSLAVYLSEIGSQSRRMGARRTEQIKLIAAYLNGLAIAVFAVGGFAPLFSGNMPHPGDPGFWSSVGFIAGCWIASPILHFIARRALEKLPNDEPSDL